MSDIDVLLEDDAAEFDKLHQERVYTRMHAAEETVCDMASVSADEMHMTMTEKVLLDASKHGIDISLVLQDVLQHLKTCQQKGVHRIPYTALTTYGKLDKLLFDVHALQDQMTLMEVRQKRHTDNICMLNVLGVVTFLFSFIAFALGVALATAVVMVSK